MKQPTPPSLRELQHWMKWIITDPRGVQLALAHPFPSDYADAERYTSPKISALPYIVQAPPVTIAERLDIYAEAYFIRVLESMKADFPITTKVLGELSFQKLVADYLKKFPSRTHNIGEIGKNFSTFVASYEDLAHVEFLRDLINTEWLLIESFFAKNTPFLDAAKLAHLPEEAWETTSFLVAPSVHLIESNWALDQFWKNETFDVDFLKSEQVEYFLISRTQGSVSVEKLESAQFCILQKLNAGSSLISALEEVQSQFSDQDVAVHLMTWFNDWTTRGIIYDFIVKNKKVAL